MNMCASDSWVLRTMNVRFSVFKLLLFQMLVVWCGAKHVTYDPLALRMEVTDSNVEDHVRDSIENFLHTGMYSHEHLDPALAELVVPVKVTHDGALVSHALEHAHGGHVRARRDVEPRAPALTVHYNLTVAGRDLRLDLRPSMSFITPSLMVERHTATGRTRELSAPGADACHYRGEVRGQPTSRIAISACDGLAGLLRTDHGEYWIEPAKDTSKDDTHSEGRPHVIYKRSAVNKEEAWHRSKQATQQGKKDTHNRTPLGKSYSRNKEYLEHPKKASSSHNSDQIQRIRLYQQHLEARRLKQIEQARKNPNQQLRQQNIQARKLTHERMSQTSQSDSSSLEPASRSLEQSKNKHSKESLEKRRKSGIGGKAHNGKKRIRGKLSPEQRRMRQHRRRFRRKAKNCATREPPRNSTLAYPESQADFELRKKNAELNNKTVHRRMQHRHQLSRRSGFEPRRRVRSISRPRHVEVLLVADQSMTHFHEKDSLRNYLLTIMNIVSSLYMDPTIGNSINVAVVKIILVEEMNSAPKLDVTTNADATLTSFCQWQQRLNPGTDDNPHHHDVAILITRQDICSRHDTPCSTLGVAHVAGMCQPDRSCSVNEDNGITLAHTITHELGHNFGLYHDTEKIGCHRRDGSTLHIMTPIFEADTVDVAWSNCSRRDVTIFLDAGLGECLGDKPSLEEYVYPVVPAGVMFDAATQCHYQFGAEAAVCAEPTELCQHLWCLVNGTCKTMLRPAAPGTTCGENMWCQNQNCVVRSPAPAPRDGGWGEWGGWSECSRSCGAGVSTRSRECDSPAPSHNGRYCIGERSRYKVCNTDPCPIGEPSFREVQCSKYDNTVQNNRTITKWIPYFDQDRPCELYCTPPQPSGQNDFDVKGGFVADGTPCRQSPGARDMCILGVCHKVGCDWVVDSEAVEDSCGVCSGDGSACKTVQGIYNKADSKQSGFSEVAVIPAGSKNVKIEEKVNPGNYLTIGGAVSRKLYLNGTRNQTLTEYLVAGSHAIYERDRDWEKVRIPGPITEDINVFQRIQRGKHRNPGVAYQYTVDHKPAPRNRWSARWTACSRSCGGGVTRLQIDCVDSKNRVIDQNYCSHIEARPSEMMQQCNVEPCQTPAPPPAPRPDPPAAALTVWWAGAWNPCPHTCQPSGFEPKKLRHVYCVNKARNTVVYERYCDLKTRPKDLMPCGYLPPCASRH